MFGTHSTFFVFVSLVLTAGVRSKDVCNSQPCIHSAEMFKQHMDTNILPCHNFYDFMCGNFKKIHQLEPGNGRASAFTLREQYVNAKLLEFLTGNELNDIPAVQKARNTFKDCLDEATIELLGEATISMELNTVGLPIKPPFNVVPKKQYDFSRLLAKVHRHAVFARFLFFVSMSYYENDSTKNYIHFDNTPSIHQFRTYDNPKEPEIFAFRSHVDGDDKMDIQMSLREILKESIKKVVHYMNKLTNTSYSKKTNTLIENRVEEVADFLIELNKTKDMENRTLEGKRGIQTKITVAELQKITDEILGGKKAQIKINWLDYFETLFEGIRDDARQLLEKGEPIIITHMKQFKATLKVVSEVSRKVFTSALWWTVTQSVMPMGTAKLRKIYYDYYFQLSHQELRPRQIRCLNVVKNEFTFVFTSVLVRADKESGNYREKTLRMVSYLRNAFLDTIAKSTWLDSSTKMAALNKLQVLTQIISYLDWMLDPPNFEVLYGDKIVVPGHYYSTSRLLKKSSRNGNLSLLGQGNNFHPTTKPADSSVNVNAAYTPDFNSIDIPIGILGPPFYGLGLGALDYGAIGVVMAHELGHALDTTGKEYDSWGRKRMWMKKRANIEYHNRAECFVRSYSEIMIPEVQTKVDGRLTLGENIADYIGFTQALKAYRKFIQENGEEDLLPGFEHYSHDKLLTMSFANLYCELSSPNFVTNQLKYDEHSPGRARILGVLKNSPEFSEIWGCPVDAVMNPKEKCQLW